MITSLGRTASPISTCRAEWCRRALATSAYAETSSSSPIPPKYNKKTYIHSGKVDTQSGPPRLFIRPWDGVPSMLDGFVMLRGIEKKYGKIKAFKFTRDGEIPSTYFSYFWVELEDPSRYSDTATTILQIPVPEVERKRPGGIGIADLQPFLRPPLGAQEEAQEWSGVTERMVDEVDEDKRKNKVYDLRLEPSGAHTKRLQPINQRKYFRLTEAFVKWGGFAPPPSQESTGPSTTPTFDSLVEKGSRFVKTDRPAAATEDEAPPLPTTEEPHKPFNYEFDEPVCSAETQASASSIVDKSSPARPQSLLIMQREGKRLSRKQKALLQAAAISRTPLPNLEEKALAEAKEKEEQAAKEAEAPSEPRMETDEEKKQLQNRVWNLVRGKWF
ncbi:hypothetical protein BDM02DRAFT_3184918 [Thelephora ganbajun]|uniref:Uncharacterized protein n=1 Tax=Thelephora ganbajun TaxID=370292 RepID=A0ACB6ZNI8_THEGA|nr:hypothetical protein BDM02DRAFT_3184918 [Thelephora ganbajun]